MSPKILAYSAALLGGICSLGYQFIVVPWLTPFIGATLIVWAGVICAFILAYMLGSLVGGLVSLKVSPLLALIAPCLFMCAYLFGSAPIKALLAELPGTAGVVVIIGIWCFLPAMAIAILSPLNYRLINSDSKRAAALFNFCQAAGNILGVLLVVAFLLPSRDLHAVTGSWVVLSVIWATLWFLMSNWTMSKKVLGAGAVMGFAVMLCFLKAGNFNPTIPGLYESRFTYSGWLGVADFGEERWLLGVYENEISAQSRMVRAKPEEPLGYIADIYQAKQKVYPGKVLQIGLGGGSFNKSFAARFPNSKLVTVEIDPVAGELARQYFHFEDYKNHSVVYADGLAYLSNLNRSQLYDWVILDAYLGSKMDELFVKYDWKNITKCLIVNHNGTLTFEYF